MTIHKTLQKVHNLLLFDSPSALAGKKPAQYKNEPKEEPLNEKAVCPVAGAGARVRVRNGRYRRSEEIKVAFITQSLTNASQAYAWTQFEKYAPEYGFTVQVFDEEYNAENGDRAIRQCIADGYDAICINPTDPSAIIPALMDAQAAGVIVGPLFLRPCRRGQGVP